MNCFGLLLLLIISPSSVLGFGLWFSGWSGGSSSGSKENDAATKEEAAAQAHHVVVLPLSRSSSSKEALPSHLHQKYAWLNEAHKMPGRFSECWLKASTELTGWCDDDMDNHTKQRIALTLANCQLQESGRSTYHCAQDKNVEGCLKLLSDTAFQIYNDFFLYSDTFCREIQRDLWNRQTGVVINELSRTSIHAVEMLHQSKSAQQQILERQESAIDLGQQLLTLQHDLQEGLDVSSDKIDQLKRKMDENYRLMEQHYQGLIQVQETNMIKQKAMVETLQKANAEMKDFSDRMEREFAAEAVRFNFLRDIVSSAYLVLDFLATAWWMFCLALCLFALYIMVPQAILQMIRHVALLVVVVVAVQGLVRRDGGCFLCSINHLKTYDPSKLLNFTNKEDSQEGLFFLPFAAATVAAAAAALIWFLFSKVLFNNKVSGAQARVCTPALERQLQQAVGDLMVANGQAAASAAAAAAASSSGRPTPLLSASSSGVNTPQSMSHYNLRSYPSSRRSSVASSPLRGAAAASSSQQAQRHHGGPSTTFLATVNEEQDTFGEEYEAGAGGASMSRRRSGLSASPCVAGSP